MNHLSIAELLNMIEVAEGSGTWQKRMRVLRPKNVLELGTGQGTTAAIIMTHLAADAVFSTINMEVGGCHFGEALNGWSGDPRLRRIIADVSDPTTLDKVPDGVDLMFMDTVHEAAVAAMELELWQRKLCDGAIVIVDDLCMNDMKKFWESLHYENGPENALTGQGIFRYDASRPYSVTEVQVTTMFNSPDGAEYPHAGGRFTGV